MKNIILHIFLSKRYIRYIQVNVVKSENKFADCPWNDHSPAPATGDWWNWGPGASRDDDWRDGGYGDGHRDGDWGGGGYGDGHRGGDWGGGGYWRCKWRWGI